MCLILLAINDHPRYRLVVAANRDEFYQRRAQPLHRWGSPANIVAGRDLSAGGTWMGIHPTGRFAALTNFRDPAALRSNMKSRGELVTRFLSNEVPADRFQEDVLVPEKAEFNGYSMIWGDVLGQLHCYSNVGGPSGPLGDGVHGLSNHFLDTPWPKIQSGRQRLASLLAETKDPQLLRSALFSLLADSTPAPETQLPQTGVSADMERSLSSIFIRMTDFGYGTRCSTVLLVEHDGHALFSERTFAPDGQNATKTVVMRLSDRGHLDR